MATGEHPAPGWAETRRLIRADHERLGAILRARGGPAASTTMHPGAWLATAFRLAHYLWRRGHRKSARIVSQVGFLLTGGDIHPECEIGPGLAIPHPTGVAALCHAGSGLTILSRSGTGMLPKSRDVGAGMGVPLLGDDCVLGPCNGVEGPWRVGDRVVLRSGVLLMEDVPSDTRLRASRPGAPGSAPPRLPSHAAPHTCPHRALAASWRDFVGDLDAYLAQGRGRVGPPGPWARLSALLTTQLLALGLHRAAHGLHARGWTGTARALALANRWISRAAIHPGSCVGGGWFLPHTPGVAFHAHAGAGLVMFSFTAIVSDGNPWRDGAERAPRVGDGAVLAANSCISGPVCVGDNVRLAFSAHVHADVPDDRLVATGGCRPVHDDSPAPVPREGAAAADGPCDPRLASRADWERLVAYEGAGTRSARLALRFSPAWATVRLYRASRAAWLAGRPRRALALWKLNLAATGADLRPWSDVGPGLLVPFPPCVSLEGRAGRNLTLLAMSGVDAEPMDLLRGGTSHLPRLGDDVTLGPHAGVVGPVSIGDGASFAPGARVTQDVPAGATCVHAPLRMQKRSRVAGVLSIEAAAPAVAGSEA